MRVSPLYLKLMLLGVVGGGVHLIAHNAVAQEIESLRPDLKRALAAQQTPGRQARPNGYMPDRSAASRVLRQPGQVSNPDLSRGTTARVARLSQELPAAGAIGAGTPLSRVLHTSQLSLLDDTGTNEQLVDRNGDLIADERTTFDSSGGSFDIAVGQSGARYEVFSGTLGNTLVGILKVAVDTNGDFRSDSSKTYDLQRDYRLPSAAAVVTGRSTAGREFVIVSSSGYYNSSNPNDPNNEPSPGVILLVRDPSTGDLDPTRTRELVRVGDNRLYNANALALLPNNDLLIADFHSDELRIVRDTNADGMPDTLSNVPYYSYRFSNDAPLGVAVNPQGIVLSHSVGNDTVMLALFDDNSDGFADRDEVIIEGLSIDNNLYLHGLTVNRFGSIFVIEDASGLRDGAEGNGGTPRIDAFPDQNQDGFPTDGQIFAVADHTSGLALSGLSFGVPLPNPIDRTDFFVRQHYLDFLSREPDPSGYAGWQAIINDCASGNTTCDRVHVSAAFFQSPEFGERGYFVYRFYSVSFGRKPDYTEFIPDLARVSGFLNSAQLEAAKLAFVNDFMTRAAFAARYNSLSNSQYVDLLLQTAGINPAARQSWIAALDAHTITRQQVLRGIVESAEVNQRFYNQAFVVMQYFGYLRRDPDALYLDWIRVLDSTGDARGMVNGFVNSLEYRNRFAQ
ncbi:MAG: DUF4214 domain-containing protein [bacterium]